jgi:hypothetical protein
MAQVIGKTAKRIDILGNGLMEWFRATEFTQLNKVKSIREIS